jgi:hypothetical protein
MGILTAAENKQTNKQTNQTLLDSQECVREIRRIECLNGETKEFMRETQKERCEEEPSK